MARGDILFYLRGTAPSDRLVSWYTGSPFVHVEIDVGDDQSIGAHTIGILQHAVVETPYRWSARAPLVNLDDATSWLAEMVGQGYGWSDIATAALAPLKLNFYTVAVMRYHCSALATQFLVYAGGRTVLGTLADQPHRVTPGMLARQLGVHP